MIKKGIVSVTFRKFSPEKIISLAKENGLSCIEWGSDMHVPEGDLENAGRVAEMMKTAGLETVSYGTYYRLGSYENPEEVFENYLKTAHVLEAKNLRIWAGTKNSGDASPSERAAMVNEAKKVCKMAKEQSKTVSFEYHSGTLTDNEDSAARLMEEIGADNLYLYWQPNQFKSEEYNINALKKVKKYVSNIHLFQWSGTERFPLKDGITVWKRYLELLDGDRAVLMEFVKDDTEQQFIEDVSAFSEIIK